MTDERARDERIRELEASIDVLKNEREDKQ